MTNAFKELAKQYKNQPKKTQEPAPEKPLAPKRGRKRLSSLRLGPRTFSIYDVQEKFLEAKRIKEAPVLNRSKYIQQLIFQDAFGQPLYDTVTGVMLPEAEKIMLEAQQELDEQQ